MKTALLIPIYQPTGAVLPFLASIEPSSFALVVVVDDGSGDAYAPIFEAIRSLANFHVISYPKNAGKGHALKRGFAYLKEEHPEIEGVVTADGDGQHCLADILRVRDALTKEPDHLILGERDFSLPNVPKHNKWGNKLSALYFHLATGVKVSDTQTGLRGIPASLFSLALECPGERYEYEMSFLMDAVKLAPVTPLSIQTIYDGNKSSHFHPFRDSLRIYKIPLLYLLVALASFGIDEGLFTLFSAIGPTDRLYEILVATVGARLLSGAFNFTLENYFVFSARGKTKEHLGKYLLVFAVNMALSFGLTYAFSALPENLTLIKIVVDVVLFLVNYFVSRGWIFAVKSAKKQAAKKAAAKEALK